MREGLVDKIFNNLKIEDLSKVRVGYYLTYLEEIIPQEKSENRKTQFLKWQMQLHQRLKEIDSS